jgi:hypothetical protein
MYRGRSDECLLTLRQALASGAFSWFSQRRITSREQPRELEFCLNGCCGRLGLFARLSKPNISLRLAAGVCGARSALDAVPEHATGS